MRNACRRFVLAAILPLAISGVASAQAPPVIDESTPPPFDNYPWGPDSQSHPSVPAGKTFEFQLNDSKVFPGTERTITVYIPAAYHAEKPACVYVGLDGLGFNATTVFDNLIAQHAMPVTIAIGITAGSVPSMRPPENPRFDRSLEFDSMNDQLATFLLNEVLPAVERHKTPDGKQILLSSSPNDRAIGGGSTGAIAAFTLAWERPDAFRRVFSSIGTYVGMRGGEQYYVQVRKTEPKPIRIFMQDGVHDEWPGGPEMGDWWMSNLTMNRALEYAGYDVRHVWGAGTHNGGHGTAVFPDAMRWLWRDYPTPIRAGTSANLFLQAILEPGQNWEASSETCSSMLMADHDGKISCAPKGHDFAARSNGDKYMVTGSELWLHPASGKRRKLDTGLKGADGVALSPDGLWLFVTQSLSRTGISYRVLADGGVDARAPFYVFYVPAWADDSGAGQICMDRDGRAYVATRMGVQVFDRNGRVAAILPLPGNAAATGVRFGGAGFDTLFVASGGKVYRRKLHIRGVAPGEAPFPLPEWGAG
jgi:gluconolactonase